MAPQKEVTISCDNIRQLYIHKKRSNANTMTGDIFAQFLYQIIEPKQLNLEKHCPLITWSFSKVLSFNKAKRADHWYFVSVHHLGNNALCWDDAVWWYADWMPFKMEDLRIHWCSTRLNLRTISSSSRVRKSLILRHTHSLTQHTLFKACFVCHENLRLWRKPATLGVSTWKGHSKLIKTTQKYIK